MTASTNPPAQPATVRQTVRQLRDIATGYAFTEGPRWHNDTLWFSDFFTKQVTRVRAGGTPEVVCVVGGQPSGLGFLPDDDLLIVSMTDRQLLRWNGTDLRLHADLAGMTGGDLNDLLVLASGRSYVGNFGSNSALEDPVTPTRLILVEPDGSSRPVGDDLIFPNGMVSTDDGETLLVAESFAARITAFDIASDGNLVNRRVWAQLSEPADVPSLGASLRTGPVPDGIALDAGGRLWVADAGGGALLVEEGGRVVDRIDVPGSCVYAVAVGGSGPAQPGEPDEDPGAETLFMCVAPSLAEYDAAKERLARIVATPL